jgi:membrane protein
LLGRFVPPGLIICGLVLFFMVIPNRQVRFRSALIGAIVSGVLFVMLRKVFGWYVATFPTYQNVYGTVSVVPIFLIWMYLSWSVILLGAVITTAAGDFWRRESRRVMGIPPGNERLITAMTLLNLVLQTSQSGKLMTQAQLVNAAGLDQELCKIELDFMHGKEFITLNTREQYILSRDLSYVSLHDLYEALEMTLPAGLSDQMTNLEDDSPTDQPSIIWIDTLKHHMSHARSLSEHALSISLLEILRPPAGKQDK